LPPVFLYESIDTVEVEKTDLIGFGHGYVSGARSVLTDMFEIIKHSTPPSQRFSVHPVTAGGTAHWKLRE
jgi:hypothetical protein